MIIALRANFGGTLPLAMCLLIFPIPYYLTHTGLRYRHPIDPIMAILTVYALGQLYSALHRRVVLDKSEGASQTRNSQATL